MIGNIYHNTKHLPLPAAVADCARQYEAKFGKPPKWAWVHPSHLPDGEQTIINGVVVGPSQYALRWHLTMGA